MKISAISDSEQFGTARCNSVTVDHPFLALPLRSSANTGRAGRHLLQEGYPVTAFKKFIERFNLPGYSGWNRKYLFPVFTECDVLGLFRRKMVFTDAEIWIRCRPSQEAGPLCLTQIFNRTVRIFILAGFINHLAQLLRNMETVEDDFLKRSG